jgi:hypothetical protein
MPKGIKEVKGLKNIQISSSTQAEKKQELEFCDQSEFTMLTGIYSTQRKP